MSEYRSQAYLQSGLEDPKDREQYLLQCAATGNWAAVFTDTDKNTNPAMLWLRAWATPEWDDRKTLLETTRHSGAAPYDLMTAEFLDREADMEREINKLSSFRFWEGWKIGPSFWLWTLIFITVALIVIWSVFSIQRGDDIEDVTEQVISSNALVTPTVTMIPLSSRQTVTYPSGSLTVVRVEIPTGRNVAFGSASYGDQESSEPASGSHFVAFQVQFICRLSLCETPPEAAVSLKTLDGQIIEYRSNRPVLVEAPVIERVARDQAVEGWFVFEVPNRSVPDALVIQFDSEQPELFLYWAE